MKRNVLKYQIIGAVFIFIIGTVWHFLYDWTHLKLIGYIAPVNESVWEHLKLILFPSLIFAVFGYNHIKNDANNFITALTAGIISAMASIVILFYAYTSITGQSILFIDILIFALSIIVGQFVGYKIMISDSYPKWVSLISLFILILIITAFIVFTYNPPNLPIFQEPDK